MTYSVQKLFIDSFVNIVAQVKSNKNPSRIGALFCIAQVCLLSLASVSPQIHAWLFHCGHSTAAACHDEHSDGAELPEASGENKSRSTTPDGKDEFCPVALFAQGVTLVDGSVFQLQDRRAVLVSVESESDRICTGCVEGNVQARAPPAG